MQLFNTQTIRSDVFGIIHFEEQAESSGMPWTEGEKWCSLALVQAAQRERDSGDISHRKHVAGFSAGVRTPKTTQKHTHP